jgi:hypothetical protein
MKRSADDYIQSAYNHIVDTNTQLLNTGNSNGVPLIDMFAFGAWLDYRNIPVLNTDGSKFQVSTTQLNDLWFKLLLGGLINYAWKQQNVMIVSWPMTEDECKAPKVMEDLFSLTNEYSQRIGGKGRL